MVLLALILVHYFLSLHLLLILRHPVLVLNEGTEVQLIYEDKKIEVLKLSIDVPKVWML